MLPVHDMPSVCISTLHGFALGHNEVYPAMIFYQSIKQVYIVKHRSIGYHVAGRTEAAMLLDGTANDADVASV
jgi:hypothetical protein